MEKINIAELLKDCPKGMGLDCTMYDNVTLYDVSIDDRYPITTTTKSGLIVKLTAYGQNLHNEDAKCVIFPKGKTTWEGFVPPCKFKDGDVVAFDGDDGNTQLFIYKEIIDANEGYSICYLMLDYDEEIDLEEGDYYINRLATEEEKAKLFKAIKANGYKWNAETKTLEKLIAPNFKVGDIVKSKNCPTAGSFVITGVKEDRYSINIKGYCIEFKDQDNYELLNGPKFKVGDRIKTTHNTNQYAIKGITDTHYTIEEVEEKFKYTEPIIEDKNWELVLDKFEDTLLAALATFGAEHQRMMCMEECAELIDALAKYDRGRVDAKDVITELADVSIVVEQMAMLFGKEELYPCPSCYQCQYSDPILKRVPCKRCSNNYEKYKLHKGHEADLRRMAREIVRIVKQNKLI